MTAVHARTSRRAVTDPRSAARPPTRMAAELKVVTPPRKPDVLRRWFSALAATRSARRFSRRINWRLDPVLLRVSKGRLATTLMIRAAVLETHGARTGQPRRNAVIYFHDGERVIIVASNAGAPHHPSWFHNLRAHPHVTLGGVPMVATVVRDEHDERRLAQLGDRVFPAFAAYRRAAARDGRTVPIVELSQITAALVGLSPSSG
jgi:deazaflavin-dependent oxidoreductase (nitroreductase family)